MHATFTLEVIDMPTMFVPHHHHRLLRFAIAIQINNSVD